MSFYVALITTMPSSDDHGFVDISATALNAAIGGIDLGRPRGLLLRDQDRSVMSFP
jgi:hypothetical protein